MEQYLNLIGIVAFAISGATKGKKYNLDILGVVTLGVITALGGGVIRDVLLNQIPHAIINEQGAYIAILTSIITFYILKKKIPTIIFSGVRKNIKLIKMKQKILNRQKKFTNIVKFFDAIGLGVFAVMGASKAYDLHLGILSVALMATLTGVGGGMTRDILVRETPFILKDEIYASLCVVGGLLYWVLLHYHVLNVFTTQYLIIILIIVIRLLAIKYKLKLPSGKKS